jgi:hypothetical protein
MAVEITPDASGAFSIVEVKPSGVAALAPPTLAAVAASRASTASPLEQARTDKPTTCRMFETPIIEGFSRVHPVMPFVFWLPILGFFIHASFTGGLAAPAVFVAIVGGVLTWSLTEYVLHRWVFHFMTQTIFLDRRRRSGWSERAIDPRRVLARRWWRQLAPT